MAKSAEHERRAHFRSNARPHRRVELTYRVGGDPSADPVLAMTRNIGVGGAFILSTRPEPVGTLLELVVQLPDINDAILVNAEVRWLSQIFGDNERRSGMGVKFLDLDVDGLVALNNFFAAQTANKVQSVVD